MIKSQLNSKRLYWAWSVLVIGTVILVDILHRFYPQWAMYGAFDDDFFYYAQVARHVAQGAGSTFDGIHRTNGYHPLWLGVLSLFSLVDSGRIFFLLVTITTILALCFIFVLVVSILERMDVVIQGRYVLAALITFESELLVRGGMEIVLALPLILFLLLTYLDERKYGVSFFIRAGVLSSLCILARLDSVILILLLFCLAVFRQSSVPAWLRSIASFTVGLLPVWVYLLLNKRIFGAFTPVSAQAKELRFHHAPQLEPLRALFSPFTTVRLLVVVPGVCAIAVLLGVLVLRRRQLSASGKVVLWSLALFPPIHIGLLCLLSDWPLWYWYFYPLILSLFGCMAALASLDRIPPKAWAALAAVISVVSLGYTAAYNKTHPPRRNALFLAAQDIARFAETHPGVYAMGDRSGTAGFMLSSPMIQLEGLTMDGLYLERLRAQPSLNSMLQEYGVAYYVSTNATFAGGCYQTQEPSQAGPDSVHMRGTFCQQPVDTFTRDGFTTRIFAVGGVAVP
jgi:hypothetical protein